MLTVVSVVGNHNCQHKTDVGVECEPSNVEFRLVNGSTHYSGRVEVLYGQTWGTVCGEGFDQTAASVLCRSLGFRGGVVHTNAPYGEETGPVWLKIEGCSGDEYSLPYCNISGWGKNNCNHLSGAAVDCQLPDDCACNQANMHSCNAVTGHCKCKVGWFGSSCGEDVNECNYPNLHSCSKQSQCHNTEGSFYCQEKASLSTLIIVLGCVMVVIILVLVAAVVSLIFRHSGACTKDSSKLKDDKRIMVATGKASRIPTENSGFDDDAEDAEHAISSSVTDDTKHVTSDSSYGTINSQTEVKCVN